MTALLSEETLAMVS